MMKYVIPKIEILLIEESDTIRTSALVEGEETDIDSGMSGDMGL